MLGYAETALAGGNDDIGVAHGEPRLERHGLPQPMLQESQQQPLAAISKTNPDRVENKRFIPGFLSGGIGHC